jgi:nucleotide-binding universal stress UspA family protein
MDERPIVVPVDGSPLAERAIPYAVAVAEAMGAGLLLVGIHERIDLTFEGGNKLREEVLRQEEHDYQAYLAALATKVGANGLEVSTELRIGTAADEILRAAGLHDARLLVIATHGRSGLHRWRYGSVASRVIREAAVPTLVVGPSVLREEERAVAIERLLVPLDGSALGEAALRPAAQLAEVFGARLVLAEVVRWTTQPYMEGGPAFDASRINEELAKAAATYLDRARQQIDGANVDTRVLRGPPADSLIELVGGERVDLVIMTSHTRGGLARALLGSVADRMLQGPAPVLLVRPESVTAVTEKGRGWYCYNCGRASPYVQVLPDERCIRCGVHLRACANCVYYDGLACMLQRPEAKDAYPGRNCPYFQFRETDAPERKPIEVAARQRGPR